MNENKCMSFLVMPNYIHKLILPKCNIVFGPYISSVYFQLFLNTCHDETIELWKYNKCWLAQETISKNINCARMTVNKMIQYLIKLDLVIQTKHLKHNVYELKNLDLDENKLMLFNQILENKLLLIAQSQGKNINRIKQKFNELNLEIAFHSKGLSKFIKQTKFTNTNKIRNTIKKIEQNNNGITIYYINDVLFPNNHMQRYRAIRDGISQSSVSKYTKYCINNNLLKVIQSGGLGKNMYIQNVSNGIKNSEICPICKKVCNGKTGLLQHLSKNKENNHQNLYKMYKQLNDKTININDLYNDNKDKFTEMEIPYKNIKCENCNGNCRLCYKEWKEDFNSCDNERKKAFVKQEKKYMQFIDNQKIKEKKKIEKRNNPDNVSNLLRYFYDHTGTKSPNYSKECGQIKNLLKKNYTPDQIRLTMNYLIKRKNVDLRFLNRKIEEALLEDKYEKDIKVMNSASYLVKLFHDKLKTKLNKFNFVNEVNKIQMVLDEGYTPLEIKQTIKFMKNKDCKNINFLPNMIEEAIEEYKENNKNELTFIENDLKYNMIDLLSIDKKYKNIALQKAKEIFIGKTYFKPYSKFEWAYLIKLNLDNDLINNGILDIKENGWYYINNLVSYNEKDLFDWLKEQFKNNNINYNL